MSLESRVLVLIIHLLVLSIMIEPNLSCLGSRLARRTPTRIGNSFMYSTPKV